MLLFLKQELIQEFEDRSKKLRSRESFVIIRGLRSSSARLVGNVSGTHTDTVAMSLIDRKLILANICTVYLACSP